jgi:exosome complex RNA-binding protein Rrp42 (RNase PH superfamily)
MQMGLQYDVTYLVSHASGSAHLRLANTDILVGIKAELGEKILPV